MKLTLVALNHGQAFFKRNYMLIKANSGRTKPWSGILFKRNCTLIKLQDTDQRKLMTKMRAGRIVRSLLAHPLVFFMLQSKGEIRASCNLFFLFQLASRVTCCSLVFFVCLPFSFDATHGFHGTNNW